MTDLARSGTASLSNQFSSYAGSRAIDGDEATEAIATASQPSWLKVDLGSSQEVAAFRVNNAQFGANNYKIQSSPDDSTWTDRASNLPGSKVTTQALSSVVAARYWRIYNTDSNGLNIKTFSLFDTLPNYDDVVLADSPVLYLPLNDTTGSTAVALAGSNGTYTGSPTLDQPGPGPYYDRPSKAISLDGVNDFVLAPGAEADIATTQTVELWFKVAAWPSGSADIIAAKDPGSGTRPWIISLNTSGTISAYANNATGPARLTTGVVPIGNWVHFVWTVNGANGSHYINGLLDNSYTGGGSLLASTTDINIGRHQSSGLYFLGSLATFAVYDYVLTADQVKDHYYVGQALWREGGSNAAMVMG